MILEHTQWNMTRFRLSFSPLPPLRIHFVGLPSLFHCFFFRSGKALGAPLRPVIFGWKMRHYLTGNEIRSTKRWQQKATTWLQHTFEYLLSSTKCDWAAEKTLYRDSWWCKKFLVHAEFPLQRCLREAFRKLEFRLNFENCFFSASRLTLDDSTSPDTIKTQTCNHRSFEIGLSQMCRCGENSRKRELKGID